MAVTDPDARPHQRASMFIVDVDTPGRDIVRDVPTMEHPQRVVGKYGGHAEILYEDVRVARDALLGGEGAGFLIAQQRLVPGRIHHCMRWLGVSRRAFDMLCERATYRCAHGAMLGEKQTVQNWIADSAAQMQAARLMTLHAAWKMDTQGAARGAHGDLADQVLRRRGPARRRSTARCRSTARWATRPTCRWRRCTASRAAARFYDGPDEVHRQSVARQILRGYEPPADEVPSRARPDPPRGGAARSSRDLLEAVTAND